jgi:hypothetical protein
MPNATEVNYLYRDAGNYKFRGSILVSGHLRMPDIQKYLISGAYFYPRIIGFDSLVPDDRNGDDHDFHEFESFESIDADTPIDKSQLIARLRKAHDRGWM